MTYDRATGTVVMFGGIKDSSQDVLWDTWTWDGKARTWSQKFPAPSPSPRRAPLAYDGATGTVVLFGGEQPKTGALFSDTWTWDGTTWTQQFPAASPAARSCAGIAYDASNQLVLLFGGQDSPVEFNDTWAWDGTNWAQLRPLSVPGVRYCMALDYDPLAHGLVLFGGYGINQTLGDTWLFIPFRRYPDMNRSQPPAGPAFKHHCTRQPLSG